MTPRSQMDQVLSGANAKDVAQKVPAEDMSVENSREASDGGIVQGQGDENRGGRPRYHAEVENIGTDPDFKRRIVWFNTVGFLLLHLAAVAGVPFVYYCKLYTVLWSIGIAVISGEGVTLGAHRMYSHRAFKATRATKAVLLILQTIAGQNCMYIWVRDHRQHHKFSDTDADPHNAHRGFFFSHIGWLMSRKHPLVIRKGKTIDMRDLEADRLVMFQKKFYKPLYAVFALAIPILTPVLLWDENVVYSFFISYMTRYIIILNITWLVNSAAHVFGTKPYDRTMRPVESALVALVTAGEGWHNYHHTFPWDYRAAELGMKYNVTTFIINQLARCGLVYDLKTAPYSMIEHRVRRTGDGTHRTIRPAASDAREIQKDTVAENGFVEKGDGAAGVGAGSAGGVLESYEKCMGMFVEGLDGDLDEGNLADETDAVADNNNSEVCHLNSTGKAKCEVSELGIGCGTVRHRPI